MSRWDRCITRGVPGRMFPAGYNNAYQIVQTPGYVVIAHEMIHDARIIPLDRTAACRPSPASGSIGDSVAAGKATHSSSRRRTSTTKDGFRPAPPVGASKAFPTPTS